MAPLAPDYGSDRPLTHKPHVAFDSALTALHNSRANKLPEIKFLHLFVASLGAKHTGEGGDTRRGGVREIGMRPEMVHKICQVPDPERDKPPHLEKCMKSACGDVHASESGDLEMVSKLGSKSAEFGKGFRFEVFFVISTTTDRTTNKPRCTGSPSCDVVSLGVVSDGRIAYITPYFPVLGCVEFVL
ncbi:hypothetical protein FB451DRAFT_1180547 [Mycena latifolia]|nr:hypothetical protein FB451DRAFT_1180547 [Mycena latifolia]